MELVLLGTLDGVRIVGRSRNNSAFAVWEADGRLNIRVPEDSGTIKYASSKFLRTEAPYAARGEATTLSISRHSPSPAAPRQRSGQSKLGVADHHGRKRMLAAGRISPDTCTPL